MSDTFPFEIPEHIRKAAAIVEIFFKVNGVNEWALMGIQSRNDAQSHVRVLQGLNDDLRKQIATERAAREAAETKLGEAIGIINGLLSDMHSKWLDTPRFKAANQFLASPEPPTLLKELEKLRNADTSWRGYIIEMCAYAGMVTSSEDIAEENLSELAEWVRQLKTENAGLRHQVQLDTGNIERIREVGERAEVEVEALQSKIQTCRAALESVAAHRREDKDGNYVLWIGETTFLQVAEALSQLDGTRPADAVERAALDEEFWKADGVEEKK